MSGRPSDDPIQCAILAELCAIRKLLERLERQQPDSSLSRADRDGLAKLLPAIAGVFGSELFLTRDLFEHDAAALRLVLRGWNARRVGRLLRRAAGTPIDGLMAERIASEAGAVVWRVVEFFGNEKVLVPCGLRDDGME